MQDFQFRNDTKLLFRADPREDLQAIAAGKKVLFVYGGGSVKRNGCYDDVTAAVEAGGGTLVEHSGSSRELADIERGIELARERGVELVIGAGGAQVMDSAKLIAIGVDHQDDLWDYVKGRKDPYGVDKLPLALMPTYPSSGSEYGLGAVSADARTGDFGTAYGIAADWAILVPRYSLSLSAEMTAYTGLVTLVQLSAATLGDENPVTYDAGISAIRNIARATARLASEPSDLDARGIVLLGASISTSSRLGIGKRDNFAYDLYEVEFIPEVLFGVPYRKSLTTLWPRFLKVMGARHPQEVSAYLADAFDLEGDIVASCDRLVELFEGWGANMYFSGEALRENVTAVETGSILTDDELCVIIEECLR